MNPINIIVNKFLFQPPCNGCEEEMPECEEWLSDYEQVTLKTSDGVKINAWYLTTEDPSVYVVSSHGNGDCVPNWAQEAERLRCEYNAAVLIYDYRGYGRSEGRPSASTVVLDGEAAVKWLCKREKIKPKDLIMHGCSLGGAVAVQLATKFQSKGLIVKSSFSSLADMARHYSPFAGSLVGSFLSKNLNSSETILDYYGALLQCHGDDDNVVPYEQGGELFDACPSENKTFVTMKGKDHNDEDTRQYRRKEREFFESLS